MRSALVTWLTVSAGSLALAALSGCGPSGETSKRQAVNAVAASKRLYLQNCAVCHGPDGEGVSQQHGPKLAGSPWVKGSPERLAALVLHGMRGEVKVEGKTCNAVMPAWLGILNGRQLASVLTYIRSSWNNDVSPVSLDIVQRADQLTESRTTFWTREELESQLWTDVEK